MAEKRTRKISPLTIAMKKIILAEVDKGRKKSDICKEFGVPKSTLSTFIKNRRKIEECTLPHQSLRKRPRTAKFEDMEKALSIWCNEARSLDMHLNGPVICAKAEKIADIMYISNFTSNSGWLDRFKKRYGIIYNYKSNKTKEVSCVNENEISNEGWGIDGLKRILVEYSPCNIYYAVETRIRLSCLPNKSDEVSSSEKDRVTILVASSMDGSDKLPLLVIGHTLAPKCFQNCTQLPLEYYANKEAKVTSSVFESWIQKLNERFASQGRKVALIFGSFLTNPRVQHLQAIKVLKPPSNTSIQEPLELGVIATLKNRYKEMIFQKLIALIEDGKDVNSFNVSILDAMYELRTAWNHVSAKVIEGCFRQCGFDVPHDPSLDVNFDDSLDQKPEVINSLNYLKSLLPKNITIDPNFLVDDGADKTETPTTEEIVNSIVKSECVEEDEETDTAHCQECLRSPTVKQAREALSTLRVFLQTQGNDSFTDTLGELSVYLNEASVYSASHNNPW